MTAESTIPDPFITYRRADGNLIAGEFSFVLDTAYFQDDFGIDKPVELVKEVWVLKSRETIVVKPYGWEDEDDDDPDVTGIEK